MPARWEARTAVEDPQPCRCAREGPLEEVRAAEAARIRGADHGRVAGVNAYFWARSAPMARQSMVRASRRGGGPRRGRTRSQMNHSPPMNARAQRRRSRAAPAMPHVGGGGAADRADGTGQQVEHRRIPPARQSHRDYIELLHGYRKHCGVAHALTIKTLYALGSICIMLGRKDAYEYYIEIVTTLNKGGHCHHDAFEAAMIVCRYYYEEKRWAELQKICAVIWETFIHHHHEFKFTEEMITTLYERYIYVLEFHAKVEFSVLYKLSVQYRETVTKYFGVSAAIVITAMIALANICEKNEKHYHESVTIYEEVIKKITHNNDNDDDRY